MANGYVACEDLNLAAQANNRNSWSILVSIIFIVAFSAVAWFASPKGENQTYVSTHLLWVALPLHVLRGMLLGPLKDLITNIHPQRLALDSHSLRLELLAHVGYVKRTTLRPLLQPDHII